MYTYLQILEQSIHSFGQQKKNEKITKEFKKKNLVYGFSKTFLFIHTQQSLLKSFQPD